jgi:hypothetical protein
MQIPTLLRDLIVEARKEVDLAEINLDQAWVTAWKVWSESHEFQSLSLKTELFQRLHNIGCSRPRFRDAENEIQKLIDDEAEFRLQNSPDFHNNRDESAKIRFNLEVIETLQLPTAHEQLQQFVEDTRLSFLISDCIKRKLSIPGRAKDFADKYASADPEDWQRQYGVPHEKRARS